MTDHLVNDAPCSDGGVHRVPRRTGAAMDRLAPARGAGSRRQS